MLFTRRKSKKHTFINRINKRATISVFFAFLLLSSVIIPLFPQVASAKSLAEMTLLEQAKSFAYINTLAYCIKTVSYVDGVSGDFIPEANAKSGTWFGTSIGNFSLSAADRARNDLTREFGYLEGGQGDRADRISCNGLVSSASSLWGFSSPLEMLCSFTEKQDGASCLDDPDHGTFEIKLGRVYGAITATATADKFYTAIKNRIYSDNEPVLTPAMKYALYSATFFAEKGCSVKQVVNGKFSSGADAVEGNGISLYDVKQVVSTPTTTTKYYYTANDVEIINTSPSLFAYMSTNMYYSVTVDGTPEISVTTSKYYGLPSDTPSLVSYNYAAGRNNKPTCHDIAGVINDSAEDAKQYFKTHIGELVEITQNVCQQNRNAPGCNEDLAGSSCAVDGLGWIICPVVNLLAGIADASFGFMSDHFLKTNPAIFNNSGPTYDAWTTIRNLANIAFVIVFLIIIFSQLSSLGISNYGVKKMLPRLVIAAILVNVSYFVAQIAVDVSNILGYSIKGLFDSIAASATPVDVLPNVSQGATGGGFAGIAGGILAIVATATIGYALLSTLVPVLLAAVVALVMILFILVARQALIILLVVISPLAFVAFLLPNTEQWFKKWQKTFTALLLVFPMVAVVFGASTLASTILANTYSLSSTEDSTNWFGQIIAAAILVLPLFVVPSLLKKSLDGLPALGRLAGKLSSSANGNVNKKLKESYQSSLYGRGSAIRKQARKNYQDRQFAGRLNKSGRVGAINTVLAGGTSSIPFGKIGKPGSKARRFGEKIGGQAIAEQQALKRAATGVAATAMSDEAKQEKELLRQQVGGNAETVFNHIRSNMDTMSDAQMQGATELLIESKGAKYVRQLVGNSHFMQRHARSIAETGRRNDPNLRAQAPDLANFLGDPSASSGQALHGVTDTSTGAVKYNPAEDINLEAAYKSLGADRIAALDDGSAEIAASKHYLDPVVAKAVHEDTTAANPVSAKTRKVLSTYYPSNP